MDISNRTLGLLLIAAIVVSIGSTFFMLDNMNNMPITGYLVDDDGTVDLDIKEYISIAVTDTAIDFGLCELNASLDPTVYDSSLANTAVGNALCDMGWASDYLTVENDGTIDVKVNISSNTTANALYLDDTGSATTTSGYKVKIVAGGCSTSPLTGYTTLGTTDVTLCDVLDYEDAGTDDFNIYAEVSIDAAAQSQVRQATWTLTGWN